MGGKQLPGRRGAGAQGAPRRKSVVVRLLLLALLLVSAPLVRSEADQNSSWDNGGATYIFPILRFGPNNQLRDLRHVLALAKHLNAGIVLTGVTKHYIDAGHVFEKSGLVHTPAGGLTGPAPVRHHKKDHSKKGKKHGTMKSSKPQGRSLLLQASAAPRAGGLLGVDHQPGRAQAPLQSQRPPHLQQGGQQQQQQQLQQQPAQATASVGLQHTLGEVEPARRGLLVGGVQRSQGQPMSTPTASASSSSAPLGIKAVTGSRGQQAGVTSPTGGLRPPAPPKVPPCFRTNYMPFERIMDSGPIRKWMKAATVPELRAQGWNGRIDAVMYHGGVAHWQGAYRYHASSMAPENVSLVANASHIALPGPLQCNERQAGELAQTIRRFRVVAVLPVPLGWHESLDLTNDLERPTFPCQLDMWTANRILRPSAWISGLARAWVDRHLAGQRYLAVQVRPFPDTCLNAWRSALPATPIQSCTGAHQDLHLRLGKCVRKVLEQHSLTHVYIMIHPAALPAVSMLMEQAGLNRTTVYMDGHEVRGMAGCLDTSATFLSLVEMEVAAQADAFLGSSTSSVTQSIALQRMGMGMHTNAYLEDMAC